MQGFELAVVKEVIKVRQALVGAEHGSYFNFQVQAHGRIQDGDVNITFKIGKSEYEATVVGDSVDAVVDEFIRRNGWQKAHDYLALPRAAE